MAGHVNLGGPQVANDGLFLRTTVVGGVAFFDWHAPPSGGSGDPAMGGDLSGVASNAQLVVGAVGSSEVNAAIKDAAAGTASLRTLGTGAAQAAAGNDSRLSDTRTPTAGSVVAASIAAGQQLDATKIIVPGGTTVGAVVTTADGVNANWGVIPGTTGLTWMVLVTDAPYSAKGDGKTTASSAKTVTTAGGSTVGLTASTIQHFQVTGAGFAGGSPSPEIGKLFKAPCGPGGAPMVGTITTRTSSTNISVTFASAPTTSMSGGAAAWATDDTTAINNAVTAAVAVNAVVGYPAKVYGIGGQLNWAVAGTTMQGLGGLSHVGNSGALVKGGATLISLRAPGTMVNMSMASATHNPPVIDRMAFFDPMLGKSDTDLLDIKFCTRGIFMNNRFFYGKTQLRTNSGTTDVSWWNLRNTLFMFPQTTGWESNTADGGTSGAQAVNYSGGSYNLNGGATGIWFRGAQYFSIGEFKMDIDGYGTTGILLDGTGGGNQAQNGVLWNIRFEKTSNDNFGNPNSDGTTGCIKIQAGPNGSGGIGALDIYGLEIGGGLNGGVPAGYGVWMLGTDASHKCENVRIHGGSIGNCDIYVRFGANTRNCKAIHTHFAGLLTYVQFDDIATCQQNRVIDPCFDATPDPWFSHVVLGVTIPPQVTFGAASVNCWVEGYRYATAGVKYPSLTGGTVTGDPKDTVGDMGDIAYNATTSKLRMKLPSGSWGAVPV